MRPQTSRRCSLKLLDTDELLNYIDDTTWLIREAENHEAPGLVKFYAPWIRSATKQIRLRLDGVGPGEQ